MIVGIDFGTTNTRVAMWEPKVGGSPELKMPGKLGMTTTMPSVVAFERRPGGSVRVMSVGEDADQLQSGRNVEVVRNIKRWALASDPYVRAVLEDRPSTPWPEYWNPGKLSIDLWGHSIPTSDVILAIIGEALRRVGLENVSSELRAACPIHSDFIYRKDMVNTFSKLGFRSKVRWITEEPLLFLALAHTLGRLQDGSYLVYDFGGGSFDCALATVERQRDAVHLTVYAAYGDPLLGGMDIDEKLRTRLKYDGPPNLLRLAKEQICLDPSGPEQNVTGDVKLSWPDIDSVLKEHGFIERTVNVMMHVYRQAKLIWKRPPAGPPLGEILEENSNGVIIRRVSQLGEKDLAADVDKVLLFGGTTRIPSVAQRLKNIFGSAKVVSASQLLPAFPEADLTAVALGASYTQREPYVPLYVNRLPCRVILHMRQDSGEQSTEYVPFCRVPGSYHSSSIAVYPRESPKYRVVVEDIDGGPLHDTGWQEARLFGWGAYAKGLSFIIDSYGRILLDMITGMEDDPLHDRAELLEIPPWQTGAQRTALKRMWETKRKYEESNRARLHMFLMGNPYGWGEAVG